MYKINIFKAKCADIRAYFEGGESTAHSVPSHVFGEGIDGTLQVCFYIVKEEIVDSADISAFTAAAY